MERAGLEPVAEFLGTFGLLFFGVGTVLAVEGAGGAAEKVAIALAFGTVALAGIFYGLRGTFTPTIGPQLLIFGFEAVIIGGLGSLWGTLLGGVVLGVAQAVGAQIQPSYGVLAGHLVFLLVLAVRPQGLLGRARSR